MYLEMYEPQEYAKLKARDNANPEITYEFYRTYFNENFNLSFGVPKTDTCGRCDELNVLINDACDPMEKQSFQTEKQVHLHIAQEFCSELRTCTAMVKEDRSIACLSFDFEQKLPLPHIPTNAVCASCVYVFGIHDCTTNEASMFVWPESVAHRGSNEVVLCLHQYLQSLRGVNTVMLFSDSCGG